MFSLIALFFEYRRLVLSERAAAAPLVSANDRDAAEPVRLVA